MQQRLCQTIRIGSVVLAGFLLCSAALAADTAPALRKTAPDFTLSDATGASIRLSDYKGKVVLLDFWATWCHGCNIEIPWYMEFQQKYKDKGLSVIGVAMDDDGWKSVRPFSDEKKINYSSYAVFCLKKKTNAYLQARDLDHAIPLLQELRMSSEPGIASMAAQQLQQVESYRSAVDGRGGQSGNMQTAVQTVELNDVPGEAGNSAGSSQIGEEIRTLPASNNPVLFMKGVLISVDCSAAPAATLTIASGGKKWKMLASQSKKLVLIGANEFSCSWTNRKVSVNYRKSGDDQGNLVSMEFE